VTSPERDHSETPASVILRLDDSKNNLYFTLIFIQYRLGKETQRIIYKPENTVDYRCIFHEGDNEQYSLQALSISNALMDLNNEKKEEDGIYLLKRRTYSSEDHLLRRA